MSVIPAIEIASNQSYSSINSLSIYSKNNWAFLLLILCILVVFGNVLVILSVAKAFPPEHHQLIHLVAGCCRSLCCWCHDTILRINIGKIFFNISEGKNVNKLCRSLNSIFNNTIWSFDRKSVENRANTQINMFHILNSVIIVCDHTI